MAATELEGELETGLSIASRNCKVEYGSIVCQELTEEEKEERPYFFESLLDLDLSGLLGQRDSFRSISQFYHPYTPTSGLVFQGFTFESLVGEIASLEGQLLFSPDLVIYTSPDKRTNWYGETFSQPTFRRFKSNLEFGLVGLTADTTLYLDNWQKEPEDEPNIQSGIVFQLSGETDEEVDLGMEARLGVKEGVTCYGNCLGPLKLQQLAVQQGSGFEEFLFSADNMNIGEVDLSLSGKFSSDNGFDGFTLNGSRTWDYDGLDIRFSSSLAVTSSAFLPFSGTSISFSGEPLSLSLFFDDSYELANASQSLQFNPDVSELGIDGLSLGGQALLGKQLSINLSLPTDPVDFSGAFRFDYQDGIYDFYAGILKAGFDQSPFGASAILAFRENSSILKLESKLEF